MRITKNITIDHEINEKLKQLSEETGIPMSRFIEKLLKKELEKDDK